MAAAGAKSHAEAQLQIITHHRAMITFALILSILVNIKP